VLQRLAENTDRERERERVCYIRARAAHQLIAAQTHSTKSTVMHTVQLFLSLSLVPLSLSPAAAALFYYVLGIQRN